MCSSDFSSNSGAALCSSVPNTQDTEVVIVHRLLRDGWWAPQWLYDQILERIRFIIDGMEPGVLYHLQDLVGSDYWKPLSKGDRRTAGRCVPDMIARGLLPEIERGEAKRTSRLRYRLAPR